MTVSSSSPSRSRRRIDAELAELDRVSALPPEYPGWMFERQGEYRRQQLAQSGER